MSELSYATRTSFQMHGKNQRRGRDQYIDTPVISLNENTLYPAPLTKEVFLDAYSKGLWNLSIVSKPDCLDAITLMKPPEAYAEARRLGSVETYSNLPHWENRETFTDIVNKAAQLFECKGAAISIIDSNFQKVKYHRGLSFTKCVRHVSIDAHAILSSGFLTILDAANDWRFKENPFVKSSPNIRFYTGVPLIAPSNDVIGVFSVFDSFPRPKIKEKDVQTLQIYANNIMLYLGVDYNKISSQIPNISGKLQAVSKVPSILLTESARKSLLKQYGRATCNRDSGPLSTVFERDGSGSRYLPNSHLRFGESPPATIDIKVWKKLVACMNGRRAAQLLCFNLAERCKFEGVYILEIAISQAYRISAEWFPSQNEVDYEQFPFKDKIESLGKQMNRSRIMGSVGLNENELLQIKNHFINYKTLEVESGDSGLVYLSQEQTVKFHSGICLPFYKKNFRLVRKNTLNRNDSNFSNGIGYKEASQEEDPKSYVSLYLRGGCYLVGGFNTSLREYSTEDIGYTFSSASILRHIYLMQ